MKIFLIICGVAIMMFSVLVIISCTMISSICTREEERRIQEENKHLDGGK